VLTFSIALRRNSGTQFYRSIHVYVGVWALLFNIVVCFTGFWMMRGTLGTDAWKLAGPEHTIQVSASLDSCIAKSKEILPGFVPDFIDVPLVGDVPIEIDGNMENSSPLMRGDASRVTFDSRGGKIIEVVDITKASFPGNLVATVWPLHTGKYGGDVIKFVYCIGGLMPGVLSLAGYLLWWKRRKLYAAFRR
jgi:hypothetical protein